MSVGKYAGHVKITGNQMIGSERVCYCVAPVDFQAGLKAGSLRSCVSWWSWSENESQEPKGGPLWVRFDECLEYNMFHSLEAITYDHRH